MPQAIDVLSVGELLVDLIGESPADSLADTNSFRKYPGGSAANLVSNIARLGGNAALVASVGDDHLGSWLVEHVAATGANVQHISPVDAPTTAVLVARTTGTPDFTVYRGADALLQAKHVPERLLRRARIFHTTCFALSRDPARSTILELAGIAASRGAQLSIDANYAPAIGPDPAATQIVMRRYCRHAPLVKLSADDVDRLFGEYTPPTNAISAFHEWGASLVCVTLGADGALISWERGEHTTRVPAAPVTLRGEATGAGDAFWAGFLTAYLQDLPPIDCAQAGSRMAALKLSTDGPLPSSIDPAILRKPFA